MYRQLERASRESPKVKERGGIKSIERRMTLKGAIPIPLSLRMAGRREK